MSTIATATNVCASLQALQRKRRDVLGLRNMQENALRARVASTLGYEADLSKKERRKMFKDAQAVINAVRDNEWSDCPLVDVIRTGLCGINAFQAMLSRLDKEMTKLTKGLPVSPWVARPEQRGFGPLMLAVVIGETGDLHNYANPAKVWRRLGCAPWVFGDRTLMGATWRAGKEGKLPAEEWEKYGYSPRRRGISYLVGEGLMKQNILKPAVGAGDRSADTDSRCAGPYRLRYEQSKATFQERHPDYSKKRCHLHGLLLAAKLLLKNLWCEWTGNEPRRCESE